MSDVTVTDYVVCFECEILYKYDGHKTGTSNLLRHSCRGSAPQPNKPSSTQAHSEQENDNDSGLGHYRRIFLRAGRGGSDLLTGWVGAGVKKTGPAHHD